MAVVVAPAPAQDPVPPVTLLYQNFPNPFPSPASAGTCIWFDLAVAGAVELDVLDLRGNLVRRLIPGSDFTPVLAAGRYGRGTPCDPRLSWDGAAADGRALPAGVYLYRLRTGGRTQFKRMVYRGGSP